MDIGHQSSVGVLALENCGEIKYTIYRATHAKGQSQLRTAEARIRSHNGVVSLYSSTGDLIEDELWFFELSSGFVTAKLNEISHELFQLDEKYHGWFYASEMLRVSQSTASLRSTTLPIYFLLRMALRKLLYRFMAESFGLIPLENYMIDSCPRQIYSDWTEFEERVTKLTINSQLLPNGLFLFNFKQEQANLQAIGSCDRDCAGKEILIAPSLNKTQCHGPLAVNQKILAIISERLGISLSGSGLLVDLPSDAGNIRISWPVELCFREPENSSQASKCREEFCSDTSLKFSVLDAAISVNEVLDAAAAVKPIDKPQLGSLNLDSSSQDTVSSQAEEHPCVINGSDIHRDSHGGSIASPQKKNLTEIYFPDQILEVTDEDFSFFDEYTPRCTLSEEHNESESLTSASTDVSLVKSLSKADISGITKDDVQLSKNVSKSAAPNSIQSERKEFLPKGWSAIFVEGTGDWKYAQGGSFYVENAQKDSFSGSSSGSSEIESVDIDSVSKKLQAPSSFIPEEIDNEQLMAAIEFAISIPSKGRVSTESLESIGAEPLDIARPPIQYSVFFYDPFKYFQSDSLADSLLDPTITCCQELVECLRLSMTRILGCEPRLLTLTEYTHSLNTDSDSLSDKISGNQNRDKENTDVIEGSIPLKEHSRHDYSSENAEIGKHRTIYEVPAHRAVFNVDGQAVEALSSSLRFWSRLKLRPLTDTSDIFVGIICDRSSSNRDQAIEFANDFVDEYKNSNFGDMKFMGVLSADDTLDLSTSDKLECWSKSVMEQVKIFTRKVCLNETEGPKEPANLLLFIIMSKEDAPSEAGLAYKLINMHTALMNDKHHSLKQVALQPLYSDNYESFLVKFTSYEIWKLALGWYTRFRATDLHQAQDSSLERNLQLKQQNQETVILVIPFQLSLSEVSRVTFQIEHGGRETVLNNPRFLNIAYAFNGTKEVGFVWSTSDSATIHSLKIKLEKDMLLVQAFIQAWQSISLVQRIYPNVRWRVAIVKEGQVGQMELQAWIALFSKFESKKSKFGLLSMSMRGLTLLAVTQEANKFQHHSLSDQRQVLSEQQLEDMFDQRQESSERRQDRTSDMEITDREDHFRMITADEIARLLAHRQIDLDDPAMTLVNPELYENTESHQPAHVIVDRSIGPSFAVVCGRGMQLDNEILEDDPVNLTMSLASGFLVPAHSSPREDTTVPVFHYLLCANPDDDMMLRTLKELQRLIALGNICCFNSNSYIPFHLRLAKAIFGPSKL